MDAHTAHMLELDLCQWLAFLRSGNIRAATPAMQRWYGALAREMERCGLTDVPEALRTTTRIREAVYAALEQGRVCFYSRTPATAGLPELWAKFFILELGMSEAEFCQWAERAREWTHSSR